MANSKSAIKRVRQTITRTERNRAASSRMRNQIKALRNAAESGDVAAAQSALPQTLSIIDASARKGLIHTNTAARYKSRLTRLVAGLSATEEA